MEATTKQIAIGLAVVSGICAVGWLVSQREQEAMQVGVGDGKMDQTEQQRYHALSNSSSSSILSYESNATNSNVSAGRNASDLSAAAREEAREIAEARRKKQYNDLVVRLFREFEQLGESPSERQAQAKKGEELMGVIEAEEGKNRLYGVLASQLSDVYGALEDVERQKQWLLVAEETIMNGGDDLLADYFRIVTKLSALYHDLQDYEEAAEWAHNAAVTMEEIYLKSQQQSDVMQYAISYFNYSFYSAYSGHLTLAAKWYYFARDLLCKFFLFRSQTLDVIKSRTLYLANISQLPDALMELCGYVKRILAFFAEDAEAQATVDALDMTDPRTFCHLRPLANASPDQLEHYSALLLHVGQLLFLDARYEECEAFLDRLSQFNSLHNITGTTYHQTRCDRVSLLWAMGETRQDEAIALEDEIIRLNEPSLSCAQSTLAKTTTSLLYRDKYILELSLHQKHRTQSAGEKFRANWFMLEQTKFFLVAEFEDPSKPGEFFEVSKLVSTAESKGTITLYYTLERSVDRQAYFRVRVSFYEDESKSKLLGTHRQLVYSVYKK